MRVPCLLGLWSIGLSPGEWIFLGVEKLSSCQSTGRNEWDLWNFHHEWRRVVEMAAEMGAVSVFGAGGGIVCAVLGVSAGAERVVEFLQVGRAAE